MIPQSEIEELASFWTNSGDAISFYFQPPRPSELAHREEPVLTKESIQQTFGRLRASHPSARRDVERLLSTVAGLKGNHSHGCVIFACAGHNFWREYDISGLDTGVHFEAGNSFTLAPLVPALERNARYCIALADRNRARLLLLEGGVITEHSQVLDEEKEKIRTVGTGGSTKLERRVDEFVRQHFKFLADHLLHFYEHKDFDYLLIGCRDEMWNDIRSALHPQLMRIFVGQFAVDPGLASRDEILERVRPLIEEKKRSEESQLIDSIFGEAARNGLGCTGLPAVIGALEKGEVRTLLWSQTNGSQPQGASGCPNCGHIVLRRTDRCELCGRTAHFYADAREAIFRRATALGLEIRMIRNRTLPASSDVVALLRFRSDRNTAEQLAS